MHKEIAKRILIGGSGSTGSSLLKNILNRHPSIYAGVETSLFCKKELYSDWNQNKFRIFKRGYYGLRNYGWHLYNGTDLLNNEYGYSLEEVSLMMSKSRTFQEFGDLFFGTRMIQNDKHIWCEKTPANTYSFYAFLNLFDKARCIHMVRDPYDTIASLMARGFDLYYATGIYLLNTAAALRNKPSEHYHEVKYESLTAHPNETLKELYTFLDVDYYTDKLEKKETAIEVTQLSGWKYDETGEIGKQSVGRFNSLDDSERALIELAVDRIRVSLKGMKYFDINISRIKDICDLLNYEYRVPSMRMSLNLNLSKWRDVLRRTSRTYPTGLFNYPLEIISE